MKTTIDIPKDELEDAIRFTGAKTKRDAVVFALEDFNRRQRVAEVVKSLGTFTSLADNEEIEADQLKAQKERWNDAD